MKEIEETMKASLVLPSGFVKNDKLGRFIVANPARAERYELRDGKYVLDETFGDSGRVDFCPGEWREVQSRFCPEPGQVIEL